MPLILELGDVLDAKTEAILLTVDGSARNKRDPARPIRGGKEILGGNISNQFSKRWPDDWEDMQPDISFPIPIGYSLGIPWEGDCPWRLIVLASRRSVIFRGVVRNCPSMRSEVNRHTSKSGAHEAGLTLSTNSAVVYGRS